MLTCCHLTGQRCIGRNMQKRNVECAAPKVKDLASSKRSAPDQITQHHDRIPTVDLQDIVKVCNPQLDAVCVQYCTST